MASMRFGVMGFCVAPYEDLALRVRSAEELGLDSAWVDDDILTPGYADFEPWTLLAALARETTRLRLGTLVTVPTFRQLSAWRPCALDVPAVGHRFDHYVSGQSWRGMTPAHR